MHHSQSQPASQVKEATFAGLYQQHAPPIFAYLCHRVDRYEDAEDLLLEVFTATLQEEKLLQIDTTQLSPCARVCSDIRFRSPALLASGSSMSLLATFPDLP